MTDAEADKAAWTVFGERGSTAGPGSDATVRVESGPHDLGRPGKEPAKVGGARAIGLALEVGRNAVWPTLAWRVPGLPWVLDRIYDLIATNRHRLPGETPWCEMHPDQCAASAP